MHRFPARLTQNTNGRQYIRKRTHTLTVRCFYIDWSLMETSRLHPAVRKVSNSVTYLITLSSASLSYYKFSLELFDRTAYEYANSFTTDGFSCVLINLHVVRVLFISRCSFSRCPFSLFLDHQLLYSVCLSRGIPITASFRILPIACFNAGTKQSRSRTGS